MAEVAAVEVHREQGLFDLGCLDPNEGHQLAVWGDVGVVVKAHARERGLGELPAAGAVGAHDGDAVIGAEDDVPAIGREGGLALDAGGGQVAQSAPVGTDQGDAGVGFPSEFEDELAAVRRPVGMDGVALNRGDLANVAAVGAHGEQLHTVAGFC